MLFSLALARWVAAEQVTVFLATGLHDAEHEPNPEERIEIVPWPLGDLWGAIEACEDAKSLIGLYEFAELRRVGQA